MELEKNLYFEEYKEALNGVGPKTKEMILARAAADDHLNLWMFVRLCKLAYPEQA